jgi:mannose-6-phosphate isomerase-like protein (cupin superfamily)
LELRSLDRAHLNFENNLEAQRLLPWPALNAPFEGSWCVIAPGTASTPHAHHDYEIFIAINGEATLETEGKSTPFKTGDVVYFKPNERHSVVNESGRDFEMYCVWWDPEMTQRFTARHESGE